MHLKHKLEDPEARSCRGATSCTPMVLLKLGQETQARISLGGAEGGFAVAQLVAQ